MMTRLTVLASAGRTRLTARCGIAHSQRGAGKGSWAQTGKCSVCHTKKLELPPGNRGYISVGLPWYIHVDILSQLKTCVLDFSKSEAFSFFFSFFFLFFSFCSFFKIPFIY